MKTPFSDILEKDEGKKRFYAFRKRDKDGYKEAFCEVLNLLDWENGKKNSILIIGPGTGEADVKPFVEAAKKIRITEKIELKLVEAHAVNGLLEQAIEAEIEPSFEEADIATWFRKAGTEKYDLIIAMQVVQHFPDWRSLLCCLTNNLEDNGLFVFDHMDGDLLQAIQGQDDTPFATHFPENTYPKTAINYYRRREYVTGVFWDPEFVANRPYLLEKVLERAGFEKKYASELLSCTRNVQKEDMISAFSGRGFGPLAWGKPLDNDANEGKLLDDAVGKFNALSGHDYSEEGECQLYCYQKHGKNIDANLEQVLSHDVQGSFSAFSKLDKHLRHDITLDTELKSEDQRNRYIRTLMQCLLFSGSVNDSVAFIIPTFGHPKNLENWDLEVGHEQAILIREDQGDAFERIFHRTVHSILAMQEGAFSKFLLGTMRLPIHFRLEKGDSISVGLDHMHPCGSMLTVKIPPRSPESVDVCDIEFGVKLERQFQQYQYGELKYGDHQNHYHAAGEIADNTSLIELKKALAENLKEFMREEDESGNIIGMLSHYLFSYAYLLERYNITIFGFYQVYPHRDDPELSRDTTGLGLLVMGEVCEEGRYPELKETQRHLLYFMCREMASAMLFQAVGEITTKHGKLVKYEKMLRLMEKPLSRVTDAMQVVQSDFQELRAILYEPQRGIFAAQKNISPLFVKGEVIENPSGAPTTIQHEPKDYENGGKDDAKWILAHVLARFLGKELKGDNAQDALEQQICCLDVAVKNQDNPLHEYSEAILCLLGADNARQLVSESPIKYLDAVKERLFSPYKPDVAVTEPIRYPVLCALLPKNVVMSVSANFGGVALNEEQKQQAVVVVAGANPLSIHGHLLEFISGVVSANKGRIKIFIKSKFKERDNPESVIVEFKSTSRWIEKEDDMHDEFTTFLNEICQARRDNKNLDQEYGDFRRPFVTLIKRCDSGSVPKPKVGDDYSVSMIWKRLEIEFSEYGFSLISYKRGASE